MMIGLPVSGSRLCLKPCPRLEHLCISLCISSLRSGSTLWDHVVDVLRGSPLPVLKTLTFEYTMVPAYPQSGYCNTDLSEEHAAALEATLLAIPSLEKVVFRAPEGKRYVPYRKLEQDHLRSRLPELDKRRILVIA